MAPGEHRRGRGGRRRSCGPSAPRPASAGTTAGPSAPGSTCTAARAGRRLDRRDAAARGRVAQRAADVVAEADRAHARRPAPPPRRPTIRRWCAPGCHGLRVRPYSAESVCTRSAMSGQFVRPIGMAPAPLHALDDRRVDRSAWRRRTPAVPSWSTSRRGRCSA